MKKNLLYFILFLMAFSVKAQENIVSFSTEDGTHALSTDRMYTHYFVMPNMSYDLREVGVNLDASTTSTNAVIRFAIYDLGSTDLLWESGDVSVSGGTEEYVSVAIPSNTLMLEMNKTYRVAILGNPNGGTIAVDAFPSPVNEGAATNIDSANFAYYNGKTNYPNFPSQIENYGSPDTINWYRAISVVVKGDAQTLSVSQHELTKQISIYPNPTTDRVTIKLHSGVILNNIKFYNVLGQTVKSSNTSSINLTDLNEGTYFVEINTNQGKTVKKLIKN